MKRSQTAAYLFLAPLIILFVLFFALPAVIGIYTSFTDWNIFQSPQWTGLDNYKEILFGTGSTYHRQFLNGFFNTVKFVIFSVPPIIVIPLFMAFILNARIKGHKFFQTVYYLPSLLPISAVILTWVYVFNKNNGIINNLFHIDANWGGIYRQGGEQPWTWIALVIITIWWCIGQNLVIYLSALASVRKDLIDAASIDGANSLQKAFYIMLPQIRHPLLYTVIITTILQFNIYGQPQMFSTGGPNESTYVLIMYIRQIAFGSGEPQAGIASAMAVMLGLCILVIAAFQYRFMRSNNN